MNHKNAWMLLMVALIAAAVSAGAWYHANAALNQTRSQLFELQPISTMLKENQTLINELQPEPFTEKGSGILGAYLTKIRRDGVPQHAELKQRLDTLAENNATIVALIKTYSPHARTPAVTPEGDKIRNYASAWRDRWNSVMELFMAGGNYAASGVPLPSGFAAAVDAEIPIAK